MAAYGWISAEHGKSGTKGHIAYIGQLEAISKTLSIRPNWLSLRDSLEFSSGGGFVLRFAGSPRQELFSNYLLLSPWISRTQQRCVRAAAAGLRWGFRASSRSPF